MTFTHAVIHQAAETTNGMQALRGTANANLDYFFRAPAMRGQDVLPLFMAAFVADRELALRITQWMRDVRGGAGERQLFRDVLTFLVQYDVSAARALMHKIPEIGRWDDLLVIEGTLKSEAFAMIAQALSGGNRLCAKWMPRQGVKAAELRTYLGWSPKRWRKTLVSLTNVVEQQMCARAWDDIEFAHVPSLASARYRAAFARHTSKFADYVQQLQSGDSTIHADVVYPYDVLKHVKVSQMSSTELAHVVAQWQALPDYVGSANVLPMVDVSGSMMMARISSALTYLDVAVSLGLYLAEKNRGPFRDTFLTFSSQPELLHLRGNIVEKIVQMRTSLWHTSTRLDLALDIVLQTAVAHAVAPSEMPQMLLILSDMQFNAYQHVSTVQDNVQSLSAIEMIRVKYAQAGYQMPVVVFWNLNGSYANVPVDHDTTSVALVSGFSPHVLNTILSHEFDELNPERIMRRTVMIDRYAL